MVVSLQNLCVGKVPIVITNHPDVKDYIFCSSLFPLESCSKFGEWKVALESIIPRIIEKFPQRLVDMVHLPSIPFIALGILRWADFIKSNFGLTFEFSRNFINCSHFTSEGTIDEEKIAKVLVRNHNLETIVRYKIACYYFMEEEIILLGNKLQEETNFNKLIENHDSGEPIVMWSNFLKKRLLMLSSPMELMDLNYNFIMKAFRYGLTNKNVAAVKYCWNNSMTQNVFQALPPMGGGEALLRDNNASRPSVFFKNWELSALELFLSRDFEGCRNVLLFFLRRLNQMELEEYLRVQSVTSIFKYLLLWPYQNILTNKLVPYLQNLKYCDHNYLVHNIVELIKDPHLSQTYDYRNLLKEYLINRPVDPRKHIVFIESLSSISNNFFIPSVPLLKNLHALGRFSPEDEQIISLISEFEDFNSEELFFILKLEENEESSILISLKDLQLEEEFLRNQNIPQQEFSN
ncbi:UNVERIFIED_CONTAM: hypothetical protein RMT77_015669 [Armadillidium vulgare]